jgi:hypothetical protein
LGMVLVIKKRIQSEEEKKRESKYLRCANRLLHVPGPESFRLRLAKATLPCMASWGMLINGRYPTIPEFTTFRAAFRRAVKGRLV